MPSYLLIVRAHLRFPLDARHPPRATSPLFSLRHYLATSLLQVAPVSPKPFRMNTCKNAPKPASLTTFRMNTCKSVSKQRTLTAFRMNTYEKHRGGLLWLTRHPEKDVCPACPDLIGEEHRDERPLSLSTRIAVLNEHREAKIPPERVGTSSGAPLQNICGGRGRKGRQQMKLAAATFLVNNSMS